MCYNICVSGGYMGTNIKGVYIMYRNSFQMNGNVNNRRRYRIVLLLCLIFMVSTIVLACTVGGNSIFRSKTNAQLEQRTVNAISSAIEEVNRMGGLVTSNTASRLAVVRQYVYLADQLNNMAIHLSGEGARMAPADAFTAIYDDLNKYEAQTQASTTSTHDIRTLLLSHLTQLQSILIAP